MAEILITMHCNEDYKYSNWQNILPPCERQATEDLSSCFVFRVMACRRDPHASGKGIFLTLVISLPDCSVLPPDCPYSLLLVRTVTLDGRQPPQATLEHSLPCLGSPYSTPLCPLEPPSSPSSSILEESVPP